MRNPVKLPGGSLAFLAIACAGCLNSINGTLIVTAFPALAEAFGLPYAHISALVMYFMAATAASQPIAGALGDLLGRKRVFVAGILGFCVSSLAAGFSTTYEQLIVWRIGQAIFSGTITANAATLIYRIAPEAKIATYLGFLSSAMLGSSALAFPLGGLIIYAADWHFLFWCSVPVGLVALVLVAIFVPRDTNSRGKISSVCLMGLPFIPFAASLQRLIEGRPFITAMALCAVSTLGVAWLIRRSPGSVEQFRLVSNVRFNLGSLVALFAAGTTFGLMFMLPVWATATLGIAPAELGAYLACYTFAMMLASPASGRHIDIFGDRHPRITAQILVLLGIGLLLAPLYRPTFAAAMLLIGGSSAIAQIIAQRATLLATPVQVQALAMGIFNSYRAIGGILGNAVPAVIFALYPESTGAGDRTVLLWLALVYVVPLCLSLWWTGRIGKRRDAAQ